MADNNQEINGSEKDEAIKDSEPLQEEKEVKIDSEKSKAKFTFKCTRCDKCCLARGPIPITFWDLESWARKGVVANFLPYLDVYNKPDGSFDLILKPLPPPKSEDDKTKSPEPFADTPISELLDVKCPLYNKDQKKCLVYEHRPLSCRTYPLEFDGSHFSVVDVECPGVGEEGMTKEELKEMRETAKTMNYELTRMRIGLPVLSQIISSNFMKMLMKQQMEAMSKMTDEDKTKIDDIFKKKEGSHDHDHDHDHS